MSNTNVKKPWGTYKVLSSSKNYKTKIIVVNPNSELSYQSHEYRAEHWIIIEGKATIIINGKEHKRKSNEHIFIPKKSKHQIINKHKSKKVMFVEVQTGDKFLESDIVRYSDIYGRVK